MIENIIYTFLVIFVYMMLIFLIATFRKDNSIVDIGWGLGFIIIVVFNTLTTNYLNIRTYIVLFLIIIWGFRLSYHIFIRNKSKKEDFRYAKWRKQWGKYFYLRSFFQIYLLQGILMIIIGYPIIFILNNNNKSLSILDFLGILIWISGFLIEAVSDYQLKIFIKEKKEYKGQIMTEGLWKYSRHPNYFGEALLWWGIFFISLNFEYGWTTIVSPVLIDFLLLKVSGIPMLEKKYKNNKEFQKYAEKTNKFFPWFPKEKKG